MPERRQRQQQEALIMVEILEMAIVEMAITVMATEEITEITAITATETL